MGISDLNLCKNCEQEIDTLKHAFLECQSSVEIWIQVEKWLKSKISPSFKLPDIEKIFGYQTKNEIIDKVILNTKLTIYNNRKDGKSHHIKMIKRRLYDEIRLEEYEAKINQNEEQFWATWGSFFYELQEIFAG